MLTETNDHSNKPFKSTNYQISYNEDGSIKVNDSHNVEVLPGVYKKYPIIARGKTTPKVESNTYPCIVDCYGNQIYCGLGGSPVCYYIRSRIF